ncbi:hypothetical protein OQA88_10869 [Cercophora sp. LCS_1]
MKLEEVDDGHNNPAEVVGNILQSINGTTAGLKVQETNNTHPATADAMSAERPPRDNWPRSFTKPRGHRIDDGYHHSGSRSEHHRKRAYQQQRPGRSDTPYQNANVD